MYASTTRLLSLATALVALGTPAWAAEPASQPAAGLDPAIERILDRQEARGKTLQDIKCDLEYIKEDKVLEDKQTLRGTLRFKQADPNPYFWIHFTQREQEGIKDNKQEWHVFDGRWYIEARETAGGGGTTVKHEVLRQGEKKNVFKLGEGPFPVPFGQKKKDIVETFTIKLVPPDPIQDPHGAETDHLECKPRPGSDIAKRYGTVHFWIDRSLGLPVKLSTIQEEDKVAITAIFKASELNTGMAASDLSLPRLPGYQTSEDPLPDGK